MARSPFLLISFSFPPYAGVGCFRWSKFCKYLARRGHVIHVATVDWSEQGPNTLLADVDHPNIHIHRLPSGYPHNLRFHPFKSRYLRFLRDRLFAALGFFYYDGIAQRWGQHLLPFAKELIKREKLQMVVATGGPFQVNRWAADIKVASPGVKLIQDFRDPWLANPFHPVHGRWFFKEHLYENIKRWQSHSIKEADAVVSVTKGLCDRFAQDDEARYEVIRNGYDGEVVKDLLAKLEKKEKQQEAIVITYTGGLTNGRNRPLISFLDVLRKLGSEKKFKVRLIGCNYGWLRRQYGDLVSAGTLEISGFVSHEEAMSAIMESNYALQLNAKEFPYALSTKIYESAILKVPAISLNYGGSIDWLIKEFGLGHSINPEQDDLHGFLSQLMKSPQEEFAFSVEEFDHVNLANKYGELIDELVSQ